MKKITLLFLLLITLQANSQVLSQNFDSALSWTVSHPTGTSTDAGWSRVTVGSNPNCAPFAGAGMAKFASYDVAAGNVYVLTSPLCTLLGTNSYKVKFSMYRDAAYSEDTDNIAVYLSSSATSNGAVNLGTINRSITKSPVESTTGWYTYSFTVPAGTSGIRYIRLSATSSYGNNMYLDDISVVQLVSNDLEMNSVNTATTLLGGVNQTISGQFTNYGVNTITSATVNWQVDGGATNSQTLTGLNLAAGQTYTFNHSVPWNQTAGGTHAVRVWTSNPNGVTDASTFNDEKIKNIRLASNIVSKRPLYEKFTSSTCNPCASFNSSYFSPFYTTNGANLCLINYQVNWPGTGDPYYTAETGSRRNYYAVTGAPTLFVNATEGTNSDVTALNNDFTATSASPGIFGITATKNLVGSVMTVNVTTSPYFDGTYRLHAVVVEKVTTGNTGSNGETSFKNVMMKMMPDANGTIINCTHDVPVTTQITTNLTGTFIEQLSDLEVIVFVQNNTTKEIMQTAYAVNQTLSTSNFDKNTINVYPNPSKGFITIDTTTPVAVTITDLTGKTVFTAKEVTNQSSLNLTSLQSGVYLVKMSNAAGVQTKKIILN